jgi:hypothetical protein
LQDLFFVGSLLISLLPAKTILYRVFAQKVGCAKIQQWYKPLLTR